MTRQMEGVTRAHHPASPDGSVPLLDLHRENQDLRDEILEAISRVCESGRFVLGPDGEQLEQRVAELCGARYAVGCASGSDALLLALMAIDVGPGDEVVVPSFTFFATASAVWRLGARPVFADIDPKTFNVDPRSIAAAITPSTKAIIPVHLFGQCADMSAISQLAARHGLVVIEDAAQAIGARYRGRGAGSLGDMGCFSFYPTKNLAAWGDGGMLTTSDQRLAERLRLLRVHGMQPRYYHRAVGINSRLDTIQAAVLNVKMNHLAQWTARRQTNAARYHQLFSAAYLGELVEMPIAAADCEHVWNQFTIRVRRGEREALRAYLSAARIGTEIYYPVPLHRQECFAGLGYAEGSLPETELAAKEVLSLPIFPDLKVDEQEAVVGHIVQYIRTSRGQCVPQRAAA